MLETNL